MAILEEAGDVAVRGALTEGSARDFLNRIHEAATGERMNTPTIQAWFDEWLASKKLAREAGTAARYDGVISGFLKFLPEAKRAQQLGALSISDIRRYRDHLLSEGRAETTANMAVKIIRTPLTLARKQGLISNNPAEAVELVTAKTNVKGVFSAEDVAKMIRISTEEWKGLILAGYYTGARAGDVSNLKWEALNLERGTVSFTQQKTKTGIEIPLHPEFKQWLQTWKKNPLPSSFVFPEKAGKTIGGRNGISGQFRLIMKKAGIAGAVMEKRGEKGRNRNSLSFHSLRHSFNSAMANAGVSQEIRQRLTGHASKGVNDRYTHTELETLRNAVSLVPALPKASS